MGRGKRQRRDNKYRNAMYDDMREMTGYPMEIIIDGHPVLLNPIKRILKGRPYKNEAYKVELERVVKQNVMREQALMKAQQEVIDMPVKAEEAE